MNRLTKTYSDGSFGVADKLPCGENSVNFKKLLVDALGAYESNDEKGMLVQLPCKIGETVYVIINGGIVLKNVKQISINSHGNWSVFDGSLLLSFSDFGKIAFFTMEDAEKALVNINE